MDNCYIIWIISAFAFVALLGVFLKMKPGFGPNNLRVVGIVVVATFATLLALKDSTSITAAMGILGAISGYLFGMKNEKEDTKKKDNGKNKASSLSSKETNIAQPSSTE